MVTHDGRRRPRHEWIGSGLKCAVPALVALAWLVGAVAQAGEARLDEGAVARALGRPLVAWWRFDEATGGRCVDASGQGHDALLEGEVGRRFARIEGVHGRAVALSGSHLIRTAGPDFGRFERLTFSAWVRPAAFDRYNEIFRKEDGESRVLFSFQEHGTVLALGLNVGGYIECDARLDPAAVLDGQWHHCAATFDGDWLRVYLDGSEIHALKRTGALRAGGPAPGCVGSAAGGECFQGDLDDLRVYAEALTAAEVQALWRQAQPVLERLARELEERLAPYCVTGGTFAEMLAGGRERLLAAGRSADRELVAALAARLGRQAPADAAAFEGWTSLRPVDYLAATGAVFNARAARHILGLLSEYRPLTAEQQRRQTPEEVRQWQVVDTLGRELEALEARGDSGQSAPEWVRWLVEAGRKVQHRPQRQEAVAPYVPPATPETRTLSAAESRALLEKDWLHQAEGQPTAERIRREIGWARELAARLDRPLAAELDELATLDRQASILAGADAALYFKVREIKRRIAFANPVVDFDRVVFVDMPLPQGSEWQHETRHRLGYMAVPGGRLLVLEGLAPGGGLRQLMPQAPLHGSFWRPDVSYDGGRVLFCFKPHNEKSFHLYEIGADGAGLVQLTDGPYDDLDPIYLPDGKHLLFSTTRGHTYVRCMPPTSAFVLARCDVDGRNVYLVSANNEPDYLPSVLEDGRVIYTRWEYTDKPLWRAQKLWTMRPDGTQVATLWGNQSVWPDLVKDARQIPGTRRVLFTGSAHHDWFAGSVGILSLGVGFNFPQGLTKVTADVAWPECGNGPVDPIESPRYHASGKYAAFYSPCPVGARDFLVSANRGGKFVLYLMDMDGNRELIYEGTHHVLHAVPLRARPVPPVLPDTVNWPVASSDRPGEGTYYSGDVYQGAPGIPRGQVRFLRVLTIDHKTYTYWHKRPYLSTGPVVSGVQSEGVKRLLGTVPVEADGSVAFRAPAGIPLHFQLLDAEERALQTMRSFANLMPGEIRGCLGCHESHSATPDAGADAAVVRATGPGPAVGAAPSGKGAALRAEPRAIDPPPWPDTTVSYPRYVRPVLDRYCAECHTGDGEGRKTLDLTARPGFLDFDESYWLFTGHPSWGQPYQPPADPPPGWGIAGMLMVEGYGTTDPAAYRTPAPMTALSHKSGLVRQASSGQHHGVKVDATSLRRLMVWVDAMCPYLGEEEIREIPDPDFQGIDWLAVRPRVRTAPSVSRPGPVD